MLQICQGEYCLYSFTDSWTSGFDRDPCPVCMEAIEMTVMFDSCEHLFCLKCINSWRMHSKSSKCPLCRGAYKNAIVSTSPFDVLEKKALFNRHAACSRKPSERLLQLWKSSSRRVIEEMYKERSLSENNYRDLLRIVDQNKRLKPIF